MKVALVCIAKNEDNYIQEWIDYYCKLGVDNIFIYENNWRCKIEDPNIIKINFDGEMMQTTAYNHFIKNYVGNYDWVMFFDVDEFLVLKQHQNIKEFINDYSEFNGIGINWVFFGDNNITKVMVDDYSVIKRFTKRQLGADAHIKSIVKLTDDLVMGVHNPSNKSLCDTNREIFTDSFNHNKLDNIAQINHYFTKTQEEFIEKINRGRADINMKRTLNEFHPYNFNDVEDYTALKFMYGDIND
jgi:hypothetical protein